MLDDIFSNRGKRTVRDLNIVPILDMLVTIIFFLLLTAGFFQLTKLTVPPASVSQSSQTKPVAPKLLVGGSSDQLKIQLSWSGNNPGVLNRSVSVGPKDRKAAVISAVEQMVSQFKAKFPNEKTLQLGLARKTAYQELISVMDGALKSMPDLVLISYQDADPIMGAGGS